MELVILKDNKIILELYNKNIKIYYKVFKFRINTIRHYL